jgi:hypothetical protein
MKQGSRVSAILISRFLLDLRYMCAHQNGVANKSISLPSVQMGRIQSAIANEFGESILSQISNCNQLEDHRRDGSVQVNDNC